MPKETIAYDYNQIIRRARKLGKKAGKRARRGIHEVDPRSEDHPGRKIVANRFEEFYKEKQVGLETRKASAQGQLEENAQRLKELDGKIAQLQVEVKANEEQLVLERRKPELDRNVLLEPELSNNLAQLDDCRHQASQCRISHEGLERRLGEINAELRELESTFSERRETAIEEFVEAFEDSYMKVGIFKRIGRAFRRN